MTGDDTIDRRTLVKALAAASTAGVLAGCAGGSTDSGSGDGGDGPSSTPSAGEASPSFDGWMDDVGNYDGVVDETGRSEVTVSVGADGNGGAFGFGPAAVRVDAGTTVVWEWTGAGGTHNVVAEDGSFGSDLSAEKGHAFERTFEESGTVKYACTPHQSMGMKGVVVVE